MIKWNVEFVTGSQTEIRKEMEKKYKLLEKKKHLKLSVSVIIHFLSKEEGHRAERRGVSSMLKFSEYLQTKTAQKLNSDKPIILVQPSSIGGSTATGCFLKLSACLFLL